MSNNKKVAHWKKRHNSFFNIVPFRPAFGGSEET